MDAPFAAIEADVNAQVRLRRWKELERLLRFYNRHLGTQGAFWLHYSLLRLAVRQRETQTDPVAIYQWAQFVVQEYELLNSRMGVRPAIQALAEAQKPNPAVERFLELGLAGTHPYVVNILVPHPDLPNGGRLPSLAGPGDPSIVPELDDIPVVSVR